MIKKKITYRSFTIANLLKYAIAFSLLLIVVEKPVISISNILADTKFELFDTVKSDSSEENENITDDENEKFYTIIDIPLYFYQKQPFSFFTVQKCFWSVKPAVFLPPPRL